MQLSWQGSRFEPGFHRRTAVYVDQVHFKSDVESLMSSRWCSEKVRIRSSKRRGQNVLFLYLQ
ncbi:unnamed protein product, partial [Larinioides sclopetarius]